ncbi:restriction endonuclease subunit S [Aliarcobacter butzleri]|uniref:restriction endonuclease subunit S n=1 Tax=Aliarcobacter butzleri TaxID=28197 RepID=UPI00125F6E27|nr:restriction endonuclease subunit S [Aliarcobacter butzleri]
MSKLLQFANFQELINWSVKTNLSSLIESKYKVVTLGNHIIEQKDKVKPFDFPEDDFKILGVSNKIGLFDNEIKKGKEINQAYKIVKDGYLAYNPYRINVGSIGIKTDEQKYDLISPAYVVFSCKETLLPEFLFLIFKTQTFNTIINESTRGSVRQILAFDILETLKIPLPTIEEQKEIVNKYHEKLNLSKEQELGASKKESEIEEYLKSILALKEIEDPTNKLLNFIKYEQINSWSYRDLLGSFLLVSNKFETLKLIQKSDLYIDIFRGKSPKYSDKTDSIILNQKCIRWNDIELEHSKSVDDDWYQNIDKSFFTKKGDILINSTGDGTIGRSTCITEKYTNLIYDSHILLLRVNQNKINPMFLTYFINSSLGQLQIENIKSAVATKQTELGINNLKNIQFIFPPINIQNEIALKIKLLKNEIRSLNQQSEQNKDFAIQNFEMEIFNEA